MPNKLYGFSFDRDRNGHKYYTRAEGFELYGGTKRNHEQMREIATNFDEGMKQDGKQLQDVSVQEVAERLIEATKKAIK